MPPAAHSLKCELCDLSIAPTDKLDARRQGMSPWPGCRVLGQVASLLEPIERIAEAGTSRPRPVAQVLGGLFVGKEHAFFGHAQRIEREERFGALPAAFCPVFDHKSHRP